MERRKRKGRRKKRGEEGKERVKTNNKTREGKINKGDERKTKMKKKNGNEMEKGRRKKSKNENVSGLELVPYPVAVGAMLSEQHGTTGSGPFCPNDQLGDTLSKLNLFQIYRKRAFVARYNNATHGKYLIFYRKYQFWPFSQD